MAGQCIPTSDTFYENCVQWLTSAFPNAIEDALKKYVTRSGKWNEVCRDRNKLLVKQSAKTKRYFSELMMKKCLLRHQECCAECLLNLLPLQG